METEEWWKIGEVLGTLIAWHGCEMDVKGGCPTTDSCTINLRANFLPFKRSTLNPWTSGVLPRLVCYAPIIDYRYRADNALSRQHWHRQILPIMWPINDVCPLQNHVLAILLLEHCMHASCGFVKLSWMCLATGEEGFTVTHRGRVTPGTRNMKTFILVQFNR